MVGDFGCYLDEMKNKKAEHTTLYIANRAFGGLGKFSAIYKHRQIVDLAFKNE